MTLLQADARPASRPATWGGRALRAALASSVLLGLGGFLAVRAWGAALRHELGPGYGLLLAGLAAASAMGIVALRRPRIEADQAWAFLRVGFGLAAALHVVLLLLFPSHREPYVAAGVGLASGVFSALVLARPRLLPIVERPVFSLGLTVCLAEVLLRILGATLHPALLAETTDAAEWIRANRFHPGKVHFGFPINSRGFYDGELAAERSGKLVAVIGDSFSIGTVAHPLHYTSIAERELPGWEFYNVGVPGADPSHYLELLREEVLPLEPDAIVVALFVGNDLEFELSAAGRSSPLAWLGDRRGSTLARLVVRVRNIAAERRRARAQADPGADEADAGGAGLVPAEELERAFPWFADPALEPPSFSHEGFLGIERERALDVTRPTGGYACFPWLERIHAAARGIPLLFLLIPDEFQVEDELWSQATAEIGEPLERDLPQSLLGRFCRERGIPLLDLLPALRAVPPLGDGRRHLYLLRDTHWNARGNALAGRELAAAVRALLGP